MKFGIFYELQIPRPWYPSSEYEFVQNALEQPVGRVPGLAGQRKAQRGGRSSDVVEMRLLGA